MLGAGALTGFSSRSALPTPPPLPAQGQTEGTEGSRGPLCVTSEAWLREDRHRASPASFPGIRALLAGDSVVPLGEQRGGVGTRALRKTRIYVLTPHVLTAGPCAGHSPSVP